jgi:hypothetical protein
VIILILSVSSTAGAVEDAVEIVIFINDLLGREFWDDDWSVADKHGTPIKDIKTTDNSWAWIDIVGFDDESRINHTRYVNGTPRSFAIVKYDSGYSMPNNHVFVSYDVELEVIDNEWDHGNDTTEAILSTKFVHKYWFCEPPACLLCPPICYWIFVTECLTISSIVDSPETFTTRIPDVQVRVMSYNQSVAPVTYIYIPIENDTSMKDVMISRACYNGSNISRYDQTGWVMDNDRETEHVEFVDDGVLPSWDQDDNQSIISHCGRFVTVFEHPFNMSLLNISLHTPYETRYITNYSVETVTSDAKINIPLLKVIALMIISFLMIIIILKVVKCVL